MARIGILGGSFDPPHNAHLAMARAARDRIPLDRVLFMPAPEPPHKRGAPMTPYETRVKMVALAIDGESGIELSRLEEFHEGPSYTVELLKHCHRELGEELYFIVGADSASELATWRDPTRVLQLATLVVFPRTGYESRIPVDGEASVVLFEEPVIDISSSEIREHVGEPGFLAKHLPKAVQSFILDNSLYS